MEKARLEPAFKIQIFDNFTIMYFLDQGKSYSFSTTSKLLMMCKTNSMNPLVGSGTIN